MKTECSFLAGLALALALPVFSVAGGQVYGSADAGPAGMPLNAAAAPAPQSLTTPVGAWLTPAGLRQLDELRAAQLAHDGTAATQAIDQAGVYHRFVVGHLKQALRRTKDTGSAFAFYRSKSSEIGPIEEHVEALTGELPVNRRLHVERAQRFTPHPVLRDLKQTKFMTAGEASAMFHEEAAFWNGFFDKNGK